MKEKRFKSALAYKLLFYILLCSSVITLIATGVQLLTSYRQDVNAIDSHLKQVELIHTKSLSKSLWIYDTAQLKIELEGILNYPDISYVGIHSKQEEIMSVGKKAGEDGHITIEIDLVYSNDQSEVHLGQLTVEANLEGVKSRLMDRVLVILASQAIKTFIVSAFILFIIQMLVTRHLETMANYTRHLRINEKKDLELDRTSTESEDELDLVVSAVNKMRKNLQSAYNNLKQEIAERKEMQDNLHKQNSLMENIINGIPAYIYWKDNNGKYLGCNDIYGDFIGISSEEIVGLSLEDLEHVDDKIFNFHQLDMNVVFNGKPKWNIEVVVDSEDNHQSYYVQSIVPMKNIYGEIYGILGLFIDVSAKRRVEKEKEEMHKQVIQTAKMASIGELAAGVGHEINNPLAIIQGNLELLESHLENHANLSSEAKKLLDNQKVAITRIRGIADGLRTFARKQDTPKDSTDMGDAIRETQKLVESVYHQMNIRIDVKLNAEYHNVVCDRNKVQQVLMNIISNARDAIQDRNIDDGLIQLSTTNFKNQLIIEVSDNGGGIPADVLPRIFDSYYTTKPVGKGTGIGLDISKQIIESHGGRIEVHTEAGIGSTFKLYLPLAKSMEIVSKENISISGKALVVDDDENIRNILLQQLQAIGFDAIEAGSGIEALELMRSNYFDIVFTDLKMPNMNGIEFLNEVNKIEKEPKYRILVTGGMDEYAEVDALLTKDIKVDLILNKPFSRRELQNSINNLYTENPSNKKAA